MQMMKLDINTSPLFESIKIWNTLTFDGVLMTGWRLRVTALYSAPFLPYRPAPRIDNLRVLTFSNLTHCDKDKFATRKRSGFVCNFSRIFVTPSAVPRADQKFSIDEDFKAKEKKIFIPVK